MSQHLFVQLDSNTAFLLWYINESIEELLSMFPLNPHDQEVYHTISHPNKKKEWLASRLSITLLLNKLGYKQNTLYKDSLGKPWLISQKGHISISHCKDFALVAFSKKSFIGIDIETLQNKLQIVQNKFLTQLEMQDVQNDLYKCGIYWCIKEAIYKLYGGTLSMKDIHIIASQLTTHGVIEAKVPNTFLTAYYTSFLYKNIPYVIGWCNHFNY